MRFSFLFLLLWVLGGACSGSEQQPSFTSSEPLSSYVTSSPEGLFVGGTNHLYQLSPRDLSVLHHVQTGPKLDSPACHASGCSDNSTARLTDNVNKLLLVDKENHKLIACGSLFQGACSKYSLSDISLEPEFVPEPVAANDASSSTFAFIGPQRYNRWGHGDVIYVGTTFTHHGDYRHDVPAISSRNLHDLRFAEYSFLKQSLLRIDVKYRDRFLVDYVYGFNSSDHIYFVTVQKKSHHAGDDEKGEVTRLARVCVSDANFDTYTEVTLRCRAEDSSAGEHNILTKAELVTGAAGLNEAMGSGAFSSNESVLLGSFTSRGSRSSSVCAFTLSKIETLFAENIHNCFNGTMRHRGLEYISGPVQEGKCPDIGAVGNIHDFCQVGLKISGKTAIAERALLTLPGKVTALAYDEPEGVPVLVSGADSGRVLVTRLFGADRQPLTSYDLGQAILQVSVLDRDLVVLKEREVLKLPATHCQAAGEQGEESCDECAALRNPYCGWCPGSQSCTRRHHCSRGEWLSSEEEQCVHLEGVKPKVLSYSNPREDLLLRIKALPQLRAGQGYVCIFGGNTTLEAARTFRSGLVCPNPLQLGLRPGLGATHIPLSIGVREVGGGSGAPVVLLRTNLTVFDCGVQTDCKACTSSPNCDWCLESGTCAAHGDAQACPSGSGLQQCPRIAPSRLQVPNDSPVRLSLPIRHVPARYSSEEFFCLVTVEAAKMKLGASLRGEQVVCDRTSFKYLSADANINASVSVLAGSVLLDSTHFGLYKCSSMGHYRGSPDCSLCLASPAEYRCGWCDGSCKYAGHCSAAAAAAAVVCPKPQIFFLQPTSGPLEGGTKLTIEGSNLGLNGTRQVRLNGKRCKVLDSKLSVEIECLTPPAPHPDNVTLTVENPQGQSTSSVRFHYKDYVVVSASPREGPKSGGTTLTITGRNFNIGTERRVFLDNVECALGDVPYTEDRLVCTTRGTRRSRTTRVLRVEIDGASRRIPFQFHFTPDPIIRQMKPKQSYLSGGRRVTLHGDYFHLHMRPQLLVYTTPGHPSSAFVQAPCRVVSLSVMECVTPSVKDHVWPNASAYALPTGLRISNISALLHLKRAFPNVETDLLYLEDPKFLNFTNAFKTYKGDELVIEGENLATASDQSDVAVSIGRESCNVTSLTNTQLLCVPPPAQPYPSGSSSSYPEVVVHVGKRLSYQVGLVQYNVDGEEMISAELIGGIGAAAAVLVFVAVVVLLILKHKSSEVEREYKRIQIQMDLLENNVRSECKQAFAELQTDMTDLTMELETSGVPILSRKQFMLNIFFPGVVNHPVLIPHNDKWPESCILTGLPMVQFEQLLLNKQFLLALIDALEAQAHFSIRDRINFASLLSVVLANKMEYFSDVLRTLLTRLAQRSVATKHPQLMLRRTETVAEKLLTNWLAVCLYDHVREQVGPPLFVLYKAIKCQIEKGPVDAFSQEARYSLSEDGLLRTHSCDDYAPVLCLVLQRELDEAYECKALDCDSISQVKRKVLDAVYKNTPFSLRPAAEEVDLEWQCGQDAHVVLQDCDLTSKEIDPATGAKAVNTLRHYGIKNKAVVSLVPRQFRKSHFGVGVGSGGSTSSSSAVYETIDRKRSPTAVAGPASTSTSASSSDSKLFHLSAPVDHHGTLILNGRSNGHGPGSAGPGGTLQLSSKAIPEVFLTRLLSTKGTLKKFIDDFFGSITSVQPKFPYTLKWLFDVLDECADFYQLDALHPEQADPHLGGDGSAAGPGSVLESWKSNSVPLRFWSNLLKNPDLLYDVERTYAVDTNLSVVAQTLLCACHANPGAALNKESPSHKLLFAKEIVEYNRQLREYYASIRRLPRVSDQEFNYHMQQLSQKNEGELNQMAALKELFLYVDKYYGAVSAELKARSFPSSQEFLHKLESISQTLCNNM